jgi:predicted nuclease of predicted toxin-antitoxin system
MRFLIDNQLPVALCSFLSDRGYDVRHVLELGMAEASDLQVSQYASEDGRTSITKDEDFSIMVAMGRCSASVIWVRLGNCRTVVLLESFSKSLDLIVERLQCGERVIQLLE